MNNVELKPCPVCGATRGLYILEDYHEFDWYVFCDNCKTSLCNENAQTKEEAIEIWNTRYEKTCQRIRKKIELYQLNGESMCMVVRECSRCKSYIDSTDFYCSTCGAKIEH